MKKIFSAVAAAAVLFGVMSGSVFAASSPSVTVKSNSGEISYTYTAGDRNEIVKDADKLFSGLSKVTPGSTNSENLKITSMAKGGDSVEFFLRLELDNASKSYEISPLDYYSFLITDSSGNVVYDSAQAEKTDADAQTKDIPLGTFNAYFTNDVKNYTVEYTADKSTADTVAAADLKNIKLYFVSRVAQKEETATAAPVSTAAGNTAASAPTLKPKFDLGEETAETETPAQSAQPAQTETPSQTEQPTDQTAEGKKVVKVCGKDIAPGRYTVKGNGVVTVTDSSGKEKETKIVTDGTIPADGGVKQFVTTLENGDTVTVVPLEGAEKATVTFEKTNTPAASAANATAAKTNPKTGGGEGMGLVAAGLAVSALAAVVLGIAKRKKRIG